MFDVGAVLAARTEDEVTAALWCAPDFVHTDPGVGYVLELLELWAAIELERLTAPAIADVLTVGGRRLTDCRSAARCVVAAR